MRNRYVRVLERPVVRVERHGAEMQPVVRRRGREPLLLVSQKDTQMGTPDFRCLPDSRYSRSGCCRKSRP
jgi:hypothetical protein